jgi:hypothetical protein
VIALLFLLAMTAVANAGVDQFSALVGTTLDRYRSPAVSLGTTLTSVADANVGGWDFVTLTASMTGAVSGDLTVQCFPYAGDGVTLLSTPLPAVPNVGYAPTFASPNVQCVQQYNVMGIDKVRFVLKNNNAGTQTLNYSWRVEGY